MWIARLVQPGLPVSLYAIEREKLKPNYRLVYAPKTVAMLTLDLKGCQTDSPDFRRRVNATEDSIFLLENSMKSLIKLAKASMEIGEEYIAKQLQFAEELQAFAAQQDDPIVETALGKFSKSVQEVERSRSMLNSHISDMFIEPLERFMRQDIVAVKEVKKKFDKSSDDVDAALSRYMAKKPRDPSLAESAKELSDFRKEFHTKYLEHAIKLNDVQAKKKFEFTEYVLGLMYTASSFYHQAYENLRDLEPFMRDLTGLLHEQRQRHEEDMEDSRAFQETCSQRPSSVYHPVQTSGPEDKRTSLKDKPTTAIVKSGYLFQKNTQRVMQSWTRKYFVIQGEVLITSIRGKVTREEDQPTAINLRVCSVKMSDNTDRRFCFEVISPMKILTLQAENEEDMYEWMQCLRNASSAALNSDKLPDPKTLGDLKDILRQQPPGLDMHSLSGNNEDLKQLLKTVREMPGNSLCVDCRTPDPQWASINFGTTLCIECSGIHRSLGVHVSKIRSLTLDKWELESIEVMLRLGNTRTNMIFEANIKSLEDMEEIKPDSTRPDKEKWINDKYLLKAFIWSDENREALNHSVDAAFWQAIDESNISEALRCLALGANVDYANDSKGGITPLHLAIMHNDDVAVEFLFYWSCNVNAIDGNGWTALHHATAENNVRLVLTLLKRHAKPDVQDNNGKTPLDIGIDRESAQTVTALRLFAFDKQNNHSHSDLSDLGIREAMTAVSQERYSHSSARSSPISLSSVDLRLPPASPNESKVSLPQDD